MCFDSVHQQSVCDNRIEKALVFYAAALKGSTPFYDDPISDSAFDLGVEFLDV